MLSPKLYLGILFLCLIGESYGQKQLPHYKVTSILVEPFLMAKPNDDKALQGNDRYEGFCKDLADALAKKINITYEFTLVQDNSYGREWKAEANGTSRWSGMVGEVQNGIRAQIGIAPITTTFARMKVVDFSSPFMEFQLGVLMKDPDADDDDNGDDDDDEDDDDDHGQFIFFRPMSWVLWILFIAAVSLTVAILYYMEKYISDKIYESKLRAAVANDLPPLPPPPPIGLCSNGVCGSPRSGTGRVLQIIFWIFLILFLAAYIATFAADRVVDRLDTDKEVSVSKIKSVEDILEMKEASIQLGTIRGGSSYEYLERTKDRRYRRVFSLIQRSNGFTATTDEGVKRVQNSTGNYAFIMEAPSASYFTTRKPCDLFMAEEEFGPKRGYSIITHPGMDISRAINTAILEMKENEDLEELEEKWFKERSECGGDNDKDDDDDDDDDDDEEEDHDPLCLQDMAGLFYLLFVAIIVALIVAFFEIKKYTKPVEPARDVPLRPAA